MKNEYLEDMLNSPFQSWSLQSPYKSKSAMPSTPNIPYRDEADMPSSLNRKPASARGNALAKQRLESIPKKGGTYKKDLEKTSATLQNDQGLTSFETAPGIRTMGLDLDLALEQLQLYSDEAKKKKLAQIGALQEMQAKNMEGIKAQTDLRSVAHLVDTWTGSNFASFYKTPKYFDEKLAETKALTGKIGQIENEIGDLDYRTAKLKIEEALKAQKIKADSELKELALMSGYQLGQDKLGTLRQNTLLKANTAKPLTKIPIKTAEGLMALLSANHRLDKIFTELKETHGIGSDPSKHILGTPVVSRLIKNAPSSYLTDTLKYYYPDLANLDAALKDIAQDYGKAKEGGVLKEYDERIKYDKMLAGITDKPDVFFPKLLQMIQNTRNNYNYMYNYLSRSGYNIQGLRPQFNDTITTAGPTFKKSVTEALTILPPKNAEKQPKKETPLVEQPIPYARELTPEQNKALESFRIKK